MIIAVLASPSGMRSMSMTARSPLAAGMSACMTRCVSVPSGRAALACTCPTTDVSPDATRRAVWAAAARIALVFVDGCIINI